MAQLLVALTGSGYGRACDRARHRHGRAARPGDRRRGEKRSRRAIFCAARGAIARLARGVREVSGARCCELAGVADPARGALEPRARRSGAAYERFVAMIEAMGGSREGFSEAARAAARMAGHRGFKAVSCEGFDVGRARRARPRHWSPRADRSPACASMVRTPAKQFPAGRGSSPSMFGGDDVSAAARANGDHGRPDSASAGAR